MSTQPSAGPGSAAPQSASLTIRRRINATAAKVYAAWTQPAQLMRWMQPLDNVCIHAEADVRVGGRFRVIMRGPQGEEHDVSGTYLEVVPERKLVFTWAWRSTPEHESLVTVTLHADGVATDLMLKHERFFDEAARDSHNEGWTSAIDQLVALFD
ncbi:uncharacterized protein YndB with AHSA1/START domain [Paraburkholderia unamae]|uniref:Uncharacterized protein YndB with AHSA1/START domain n=2 Tax=Paraburkholderia unamae TaxID=219649 RepID=A0ABX5K7U3_9BURK|nr:uncharacterized protein YndB with AHSA1/START domain [Paraburkholderia unamae]CAG9272195.1 putative glutathione S-transferase-related transmembrane protein [Paraburkholderia unamae]